MKVFFADDIIVELGYFLIDYFRGVSAFFAGRQSERSICCVITVPIVLCVIPAWFYSHHLHFDVLCLRDF